jgi:hypothetical protein
MESAEALIKNEYTYQDFLRYYKNIWNRNLAARTIDVQTDIGLKAADPEQAVQHDQTIMPVKERLELRKILVQDAIDLIAAIDVLAALTPEDYQKQALSKEALAVAEDMLPPKQKAGDTCQTTDGKPGTLQDDGKGGLTCVATPPAAAGETPSQEAAI